MQELAQVETSESPDADAAIPITNTISFVGRIKIPGIAFSMSADRIRRFALLRMTDKDWARAWRRLNFSVNLISTPSGRMTLVATLICDPLDAAKL